jgi:proteic killer suppression protein
MSDSLPPGSYLLILSRSKARYAAGHNVLRYITHCVIIRFMIRSFRDRETALIWEGVRSRKLPSDIQAVALRKLRMLNNARIIDDMRVPPGNRLEPLKGARKGQWSIRINQQWRIVFRWSDGGANDVEILDYHDE